MRLTYSLLFVALTQFLFSLSSGQASPLENPRIGFDFGQAYNSPSQWIAYASWTNPGPDPITSFRVSWKVPSDPVTDSGQVIYIFNGLQPEDQSHIVQPVLHWGPSPAGGGHYWSIGCWDWTYYGGNHSQLARVRPGDRVTGVISLVRRSNDLFDYSCSFEGFENTSLEVKGSAQLVWSALALESRDVRVCSDYPGEITFEKINIRTSAGTPAASWQVEVPQSSCGHHADILSDSASDGEVKILR